MHRLCLALSLVLAPAAPASARSTLQLNSVGAKTVAISARVDDNKDVMIIMTASDPAGVRSIALTGNGKALITRATRFSCFYLWRRCGRCTGSVIAVLPPARRSRLPRWGALRRARPCGWCPSTQAA
jgi:hypothetical protein